MIVTGSGYNGSDGVADLGTIIDGGTTDDAVDITGRYNTIQHFAVKTTAGAGNEHSGVRVSNTGHHVRILYIEGLTSDKHCIALEATVNRAMGFGNNCYATDAEAVSYVVDGGIFIGNIIDQGGGSYGIEMRDGADNNVMNSNLVRNNKNIRTNSGADNNIIDGNATDAAISDAGTGNTVGSNENF